MKNLLDGWWEVSLLDPNDPLGGLLLQKSDAAHGHWHFVPSSHPDPTIHKGSLAEHDGASPGMTSFRWYPADKLLIIDRSDLCPDGFVWICYEESYRVEYLDGDTLKMIGLQDG